MEKMILNGKLVAQTEIKVDFEDRGYQFGDGIYEVIRVYNGQLFTAEEHLKRLMDSAKHIFLSVPYSASEINEQLQELVKANSLESGIIYLQITRGVSPRNHAFPNPSVDCMYIAKTKAVPRSTANADTGVNAITTEDIRWLRCDIKSLNLLGNILAKQKAAEAGCFEAIQHRDGTVTEGSSSNVSIVSGGKIITHPANNLILNGISRQVMLHLCASNDIPVEEREFTVDELMNAEEVFLTGTTIEVLPIIKIDGTVIGDGQPGQITQKLQELFSNEVERQCGVRN
ncbi:D-amino-acid transaminase [Peribacillus sp. SCS-155]|uniref:D-amino-acid transaminase n=1 Tax=Peribacillus sedimenti TaxID=3115297 RepID=UPI003905B8C3